MSHYLTVFVEFFRFIKRWRERKEAQLDAERRERAAERAHQLQLAHILATSLTELAKTNTEPILELARAQQAQGELLSNWLKGFNIANPEPVAPQVVSDEDAWREEQMGELVKHLPPEFHLAFDLDKGQFDPAKLNAELLADFDREGSDF